jgi:hypothetical protein
MKAKIGIRPGLIGLFILMLSACASLHKSVFQASLSQEPVRFVDPTLATFMGTRDNKMLEEAIATASPTQQINWAGSKIAVRFQFRSRRIFVNELGQGCRDYQLIVQHGLLRHDRFERTVCRDGQGDWQQQRRVPQAERQGEEVKSATPSVGFS